MDRFDGISGIWALRTRRILNALYVARWCRLQHRVL